MTQEFDRAKAIYREIGVDVEKALDRLSRIPLSMHCWQGDDIQGFEVDQGGVSGGIQATGNYPGKARSPKELMADIDKAFSLIPGKHRLNLHANYGFYDGAMVDRSAVKIEHFKPWVDFAKARGIKLDFNATCFSHELAEEATLSSEKQDVREFWINHVKSAIHVAEYMAKELEDVVLFNIWIPDGFKDIPVDRIGPRRRLKESLDDILSMQYDRSLVNVAVESKVFGIGVESYTVGSHEFYLNYAAKNDILCLLDNGHFHPTEVVSDKLSSMLLFFDQVALHITRAVRWDSDHVVRLDDETKEIAKEIIRNGENRFLIGLDFFDASINRVAAWVIGMRNVQKALLAALLEPHDRLVSLQEARNFSKLMAVQEDLKYYPVGDVWEEFCRREQVSAWNWYEAIEDYEKTVTNHRI